MRPRYARRGLRPRGCRALMRGLVLALLAAAAEAIDNGLGVRPPMGWRSYNAFGGVITQPMMEAMMEALVDKSRSVAGAPTSLAELGYDRVGLDGGWNYCFPENHTFHWASDGRPVWNAGFKDPAGMVAKAHRLGLRPGWYLNNCGCAENRYSPEMAEKVMVGSVAMLAAQGWDGVKLDSCSQFHNLTKWAALINQTGRPVMIENCHQGAYTPGIGQWQGYIKNGSGYSHFLGMFFGMGAAQPLANLTVADCRAKCDAMADKCGGFCFKSTDPEPSAALEACYVQQHAAPNKMDMSNSGYCTGAHTPSDCPYNIYRVSGDISGSWGSMLANLDRILPFLGQAGVHLPYPQDSTVRSRPGGWAYPDMLEVGNLANATEDRSHFGAWAVVSSPLILSFNLSDSARVDRTWPIISNRAVLAVNQRWAGDPGRRVTVSPAGWQAWAKAMGGQSYAVFLINTASQPVSASMPLQNVSAVFGSGSSVCVRDLYSGRLRVESVPKLEAMLPVHDSVFVCAWPSDAKSSCNGDNHCP